MKIAQFGTPSLPIPAPRGGANQKIIYELSKRLARDHVVHVFSPGGCDRDFPLNGVFFHHVKGRFARWPDYLYYLRLFQRAKPFDFDIVHLHGSSIAALYFKRWGKGVRVVASINYPFVKPNLRVPLLKKLIDPYLARKSFGVIDRIVCISNFSKELFINRFRIAPARVAIIPAGVDVNRYRPSPLLREAYRRRYHLGGRKVILFVGRICEHKGVQVLLDAYRSLRERNGDVTLILAGPANDSFDKRGPSRFARRMIKRLDELGGIYVGEPPEEDLIGILNACDTLVLPTLKGEMFGMVLVEAMSCGKYVIGSNHGGIPEVIGEEGAGTTFKAGSVEELVVKIEEYFQKGSVDPDLPRHRARQFDWEAIAAQYGKLYEELYRGG